MEGDDGSERLLFFHLFFKVLLFSTFEKPRLHAWLKLAFSTPNARASEALSRAVIGRVVKDKELFDRLIMSCPDGVASKSFTQFLSLAVSTLKSDEEVG